MSLTVGRSRLDGAAPAGGISVRRDSGAVIGTQSQINLIVGSGLFVTVTNDALTGELDITLALAATAPTIPADWGLVTDTPPATSIDLGLTSAAPDSGLDWGAL